MRIGVLMLQGPARSYFARLAVNLTYCGLKVTAINLNGGDAFYNKDIESVDYAGGLQGWESFIAKYLSQHDIGRIYLFGPHRTYHRIAIRVAHRNGIRVFAIDSCYYSSEFLTADVSEPKDCVSFADSGDEDFHIRYCFESARKRSQFPEYRHHRPFDLASSIALELRSIVRSCRTRLRERHFFERHLPKWLNNYYVCPLPVHCSMNLIVNSDFNSVEHFIGDILASFREHAPRNKALVFLHHPSDIGYTDYSSLFINLLDQLGLSDQVFYLRSVKLDALLRHAIGAVVVNGSAGIMALQMGVPVKAMGNALYNKSGLAYTEGLNSFWETPGVVDSKKYEAMQIHIKSRNQFV